MTPLRAALDAIRRHLVELGSDALAAPLDPATIRSTLAAVSLAGLASPNQG